MENFSQDILAEILSGLPVKLVCRFRCVSKSWLHLTTERSFIKAHLKRTQIPKLIISADNSLYSLGNLAPVDDDVLPLELDFPLKDDPDFDWIKMFGSCNGLVCIMPHPKSFFVFNPCTAESFKIPDCPIPIHVCPEPVPGSRPHPHVNSFGHAPSIDDYKFVKDAFGCMVLVFSLKTNSWRRVQDFPYKHLLDSYGGTFLNGALHWLCRPLGVGATSVIVAFDLAEEKFLELEPPDSVTDFKRFSTDVLGGCLCLLHLSNVRQHSIWVMKEYNVKESWTRILIEDSRFYLRPLCLWKNVGIWQMRDGNRLLLGNAKDGTCKNFLVNGRLVPFYADVYVESLVSPNFEHN